MVRRDAGFTLIEMLVALAIGGLIVGSLFELFASHGRFVQMQSSREEVQQNSRAALELIGSELRTVPPGPALVRADADSITFRASRVTGVVCEVAGPAQLSVAIAGLDQVGFAANSGTGLVVDLGGSVDSRWTAGVPVMAIDGPATLCSGQDVEPGVEVWTFTLAPSPEAEGGVPTRGNVAYLYDEVTYRAGPSSGIPGRWIQRRLGSGNNQPMAGPIEDGESGLRFVYFAGAATSEVIAPVGDSVARDGIDRVQVIVGTVGRSGQGQNRQARVDTVMISLRNRARSTEKAP